MPCLLHYLIQKGWEITNHILMDKKGRPDNNWESVFEKISLHPTRKENQKRQNKKSLRKINFRNSLFSLLVTKMYLQPVFPTFILRVDKMMKYLTSLKMNTKCGILKNVLFLQIRGFTVGNTARHTRLEYDFYRSLISTEWVN